MKLCFRKPAIKMLLSNEKPIIALDCKRSGGLFKSLKADFTDFTTKED